jgi:hypothetical protein
MSSTVGTEGFYIPQASSPGLSTRACRPRASAARDRSADGNPKSTSPVDDRPLDKIANLEESHPEGHGRHAKAIVEATLFARKVRARR